MIRKLRSRFIRVAMFAVILVLFLIIGTINILNYRNIIYNADSLLAILSDHDSSFPGYAGFPEDAPPPDGPQPGLNHIVQKNPMASENNDMEDDTDDTDNTQGGIPEETYTDTDDQPDLEENRTWDEEMDAWNQSFAVRTGRRNSFSEETPFESRYFSATVDADGTLLSYDISHIAAINGEDALQQLMVSVLKSSSATGFQGQYRYLKTSEDDSTSVLFLDCSRSLSNFRSFLLMSIFVYVLGLAGILILIILLSGRIVRPMQESYEKQKQFITDAGHELKTPLTIIDADVMVVEMETGENEWLNDVKMQTKRLAELTNDLIYLSRMDEENTQLKIIDFPFSDLVADIVQSFRSRAQLEEKELTTFIEPMLTLAGDENSLRKLVSILLDNAVKYAKKGGTIHISLLKKARTIQFIVENDVVAVDPDMLQHMFDRFYRADASRNSERGGHGIGLSIAKAIVAAHKGTITAEALTDTRLRITAVFPQ